MKCNCGKIVKIARITCERGSIAPAYERAECECGKQGPWCSTEFPDCRRWIYDEFAKRHSDTHNPGVHPSGGASTTVGGATSCSRHE
jgi:hypothetical protein